VAPRHPGSTARLTYLRDGKENTVTVTIADRNDTVVALNGGGEGDDDNDAAKPNAPNVAQDKFGMSVSNVPQELANRLKLGGGVVVTNIKPGSFADDTNLSKGDIITEVNRHPVTDQASFNAAISTLKSGDDVVFVIRPAQARTQSSFVGGRLP